MIKEEKKIFILGNGPSLRGFDFKSLSGHSSIGMNAAYRYWEKINWYPTYYICLDAVVIKSHSKAIKNLINNTSVNGIRKFFLRKEILENEPDLATNEQIIFLEDVTDDSSGIFDCIHITTGSFAARFSIYLGYNQLILLGIDEKYKNFIPGSKRKENIVLEMTKTPESNENYFFDDYQREGDLYQIPNHSTYFKCECRHCNGEFRDGKLLHIDAWRFLKFDIALDSIKSRFGSIIIINNSPNTLLDIF